MVSEVLKFLMRGPCTFLTGLTVFSELLPLPLPLQIREPLRAEDLSKVVNSRKLWSAHLHSLSSEIQEIVGTLSYSTCPSVQQLLRRVCVQLSDLAAPSASVVARAVMDALYGSLVHPCYGSSMAGEVVRPLTPQNWPPTPGTLSLLDQIAFMLTHAPFKMAMLHAIKSGGKYLDLFNYMLTLFNLSSDEPTHIQIQDCILLVNALPSKDLLNTICSSLVQHLTNSAHSYTTVLLALRILIMLTEHDFGFYAVKTALDKEELSLWFLFERLSTSFSKDSSDFLSTLSASVELVRTLGSVEGGIVCLGPLRTLRLSAAEVAAHLAWGRRQDKEPHPLLRLEKMLVVCPLLACPCLPCVRFFLRHLAGTKKKERESHHWPQVVVDLVSLVECTLPEFNLKSELEKLVLPGNEGVDGSKSSL
ncbi:hypothetical protein HPB48_014983 [Haemaphysalis longicornis]|uniref:Uncharacterized protein n=1 Tax=Haemaphysalis longicornis TaxID=44386 RepID=A0A9J6FJG8_HAELO|nr:hypothetical protein HPB48_014983 [Haemaphysalis longicornis]